MLEAVYVALIATLVWFVTTGLRWKGRHLPFPPGPHHLPFYGSVVSFEDKIRFVAIVLNWPPGQFRRTHMYQADNFARFGEQFQSDIIGIKEWGNCTIVLNSFEAVNNILIHNSNRSAKRCVRIAL